MQLIVSLSKTLILSEIFFKLSFKDIWGSGLKIPLIYSFERIGGEVDLPVFIELDFSYLCKEDLAHTPSITKTKNDEINEDDKFLKIVKNITSKGFVRSNYE